MTFKSIILTLAAAVGLAGGAAAGESAERPSGPARTAVVAQVPEACAPSPAPVTERGRAPQAALAALRSAAPSGARLVPVCGGADAQAAVVRLAAEGYAHVLWSGPEPRAAANLAAPDHPATRFAPLGR